MLIFKFLSKTRAWQNYRFYNFIVILHALLWPILWLLPVVSFMATQSLKVFVYCSQSHTKWLPILKLSQWNDSTWTTALELTKRCDLDEIDLLPLLPPMSFMVLLHYRCHLYYIYIHFKPHKIRFFWFKQPCVLGNMCILEIASYSYLDRYHFWCFSFLAEDLSFCLVSFPFNPKKNFLQHFLWCTSALTSKF